MRDDAALRDNHFEVFAADRSGYYAVPPLLSALVPLDGRGTSARPRRDLP